MNKKNILVYGSGAREHALAWKISQSDLCRQTFIGPGNAGTTNCGTNLAISMGDFDSLLKTIIDNRIDMLVVGPEQPLADGVYDFLKQKLPELMIIGTTTQGVQLEASKLYGKNFMHRNGIPTPEFNAFNYAGTDGLGSQTDGFMYLQEHSDKLFVLKANGLCAGKGVIVPNSQDELLAEYEKIMTEKKFGEAGNTLLIEEMIVGGLEFSVTILVDSKTGAYKILPIAKDYKKAGNRDTGLNTGGMGCISPVPYVTEELMRRVTKEIIEPTVQGLQTEGITYQGLLYIQCMLAKGRLYVIEYNCRGGDPETEVMMARLESDLLELLMATCNGTLADQKVKISTKAAVTVVMASQGYPGDFKKGFLVSDIPEDTAELMVFHAGTTRGESKEIVTSGGRVLAVTALGNDGADAIKRAYATIDTIRCDNLYYRTDIGHEYSLGSVPVK